MKIGIIGAKGFIGQAIYNHLGDHELCRIPRGVQARHYDIIIDANGSSSKYKAEQDPVEDFKKSVDSVMHYVNHLSYDKYIYISTIDAGVSWLSNYGFNRSTAEQVVMKYAKKWTIVRLCSVIGKEAKKGIVYDILNDKKLFVQKDSLIQVIPVSEVAKNVPFAFFNHNNEILKFYSDGCIEVGEICNMFGKNPEVDVAAENQLYDEDGDPGFLTPEEYLKQTFHERVVKSVESV